MDAVPVCTVYVHLFRLCDQWFVSCSIRGCTLEMVSYSTVDVHTRAAVVGSYKMTLNGCRLWTAQYHSSTAASMRFCCVQCGVCWLQVGESDGYQVVVGQLPAHMYMVNG